MGKRVVEDEAMEEMGGGGGVEPSERKEGASEKNVQWKESGLILNYKRS